MQLLQIHSEILNLSSNMYTIQAWSANLEYARSTNLMLVDNKDLHVMQMSNVAWKITVEKSVQIQEWIQDRVLIFWCKHFQVRTAWKILKLRIRLWSQTFANSSPLPADFEFLCHQSLCLTSFSFRTFATAWLIFVSVAASAYACHCQWQAWLLSPISKNLWLNFWSLQPVYIGQTTHHFHVCHCSLLGYKYFLLISHKH